MSKRKMQGLSDKNNRSRRGDVFNNSLSWLAVILFIIVVSHRFANAQQGETTDVENTLVRELTYDSDTITIAATLTLPTGSGPFPIVILVHGSGNSDRSNAWMIAYSEEFLERQIATLFPDKRGSGQSGGNWKVASFFDLSNDIVAAVEFVQTIPEVDQDRITLAGFSQGSQLVSIAGAHPAVDRVISISGSVVPLTDGIRDHVKIMVRNEGLNAEQIRAVDSLNILAFAYVSLLGDFAPQRKSELNDPALTAWETYLDHREKLVNSKFGNNKSVIGFPSELTDSKFEWLSRVGLFFDPLDHWPKISVPVLFIYGARDNNVDEYKSIEALSQRYDQLGKHYSLLLFGTQGHGFIREDEMDFISRWISEDD